MVKTFKKSRKIN